MMNFYYKYPQEPNNNQLVPKRSTIDFILKYSKALYVSDYKNMKFESLLN